MTSLTYVTLTSLAEDGSGANLNGTAVFTPSATVYASGVPVLIPDVPVQAQVVNGSLRNNAGEALTLLATDNTGLAIEGQSGFWYWTVNLTVSGQVLDPWYFQLPSSPASRDLYSLAGTGTSGAAYLPLTGGTVTGTVVLEASPPLEITTGAGTGKVLTSDSSGNASWQAAGGGFTNPMTTLGDLIYENATPAAARLAGDTSDTRKFLRTQATAGTAQAPAWDTIQPGDLASSPATPGRYAPLLYGAIWGWPWQFWADSSGAAGDGKVLGDCSISASSNVLSSASYGFVSGDVGKKVMLNGGLGTAAAPLIATISSVSSGNATLSASAAVTISGNGACVFGTNDGTNLATAWSAAGTYALAHDYYAELILPAIYVDANGPAQTSVPAYNSQLPATYPALAGTSRKLHLALIGIAGSDHCEFWESTVPNVLPGSIVSMTTAPSSIDPTYGRQSVIGGPSGGGSFTGGFANLKLTLRNVGIWTPAYTNICGVDLGFTGGAHWEGSAAKVFAPAAAGVHPWLSDFPAQVGFQSTVGMGIRFPMVQNNDDVLAPSFAVEGFETGFAAQDHFVGVGRVIYSDLAMLVDLTEGASNISHSVSLKLSAENFNGAIKANGSGGQCMLDVLLDTELTGGGNPTYDISDTGNALGGIVRWTDPGRTSGAPIVTGAANLEVISGRRTRGHVASPALPGSGSSIVNPFWGHAWVTVSGGSSVTISVDGTSTGLTSGAVRVPSGKTISLGSYSGTPVWTWWVD